MLQVPRLIVRAAALSRPALDPLDIEDRDGARLQPDPAAGREVGESLVDRLARGADELRQLLLGQVMVYVHAVVPLVTEPLGKLQQLLGDPTWDIGEDQVSDHIIGPAETGGELAEQALCDFGTVGQPSESARRAPGSAVRMP